MDQNPGYVLPGDTAPNTTRADPKQPPAAQGEASSHEDSSTQSNNQAGSAADVPADASDAAPDAARKEATVTTACLACVNTPSPSLVAADLPAVPACRRHR